MREACKACRAGVVDVHDARVAFINIALSTASAGEARPCYQEAHQGILGYENHWMYDNLARSQARSWSYQLIDIARPTRTTGHP